MGSTQVVGRTSIVSKVSYRIGIRYINFCLKWKVYNGKIKIVIFVINTYLFLEAQIVADDDDTALDAGADVGLSTYGCIPSLVMSVLASTKTGFTTDQLVLLQILHRNITQLWPSCQRISINGSHVVQGYTGTSR